MLVRLLGLLSDIYYCEIRLFKIISGQNGFIERSWEH